jgi:hypothetical protein
VPSTDYEKQAQDYYGKETLIVLGSGASAAHGLSGMGALAAYLIKHTDILGLPPTDVASWDQFCQLLTSGVDLETALHQVSVSQELTVSVIKGTWSLINSEDVQTFRNCLQDRTIFPLGKLITHMFRSSLSKINIVTTNYDRLAEYACEQEGLHHYTGFTHGFFRQLAPPDEITTGRKVNIWKVHGSIDWFKSPLEDIVALSNIDGIPDNYEPQIVTPGTQKYHRTHLEPYRSIINNADSAIKAASSYLCIGYGFNDEHIQPNLIAKCVRQNAPITIITYALSEATKKHILNGNAQNYLAIERGVTDDQSVVYSSLENTPFTVDRNIWSLEGYLKLII